jgi:hypothetical protein
MRAIGPYTSTALFALSTQHHLLGGKLIYVFLLAASSINVAGAWLLLKADDV